MSEVAKLLENHYGSSFSGFYHRYFQNPKMLAKGEWSTLCPFHEDTKPSLSVSTVTGQYHCHACGAKGNFIQFYMRFHNLDYLSATKKLCEENGLEFPEKIKKQIVKAYDYLDAIGKLAHQTVRFEPKQFSQRRPNGNGWEWNLRGIKTVLYNLSDVLNADRVLILEGEKDCDTAKEMGIVATTNPMGAGAWKPHYTTVLENKEIILVPDNDKPGIEHMLQVGKSLQGKATVKWFEFPEGMNPKSDFTDFVKSFENEFVAIDEVDKLIRAARRFDSSKIIVPEPDSEFSNQIKTWIKASPGEFSIRDLDYDFEVKNPEKKQDRTRILEKFVSEKILSREGSRRGMYRPYQKDLELMDFNNADDKFLPMWFPFKLHEYVGVLPGNIIIVAGEPNAGKTGFLLNMIKGNQHNFNVHYFNSEMGAGELKVRLSKFNDIGLDRWNFNAYYRDDNFSDVIFKGPGSLNIIDFLEVHDNFYLIGEKIKQIHSVLDGAVAVIAIQRNKGSEFGLGGQRTMEKARLVLNISPGQIQITKAKNFVNPEINPNGQKIDFKLAQGCRFVMQGKGWYREE